MATLTIYKAPTYTLTLQLYVRGGAATGSPLTLTEGASGVYTCTVSTGDYDGELIGFTSPVGPKFPIRDGVAYEGIPWSLLDAITLADSVIVTTQPTANSTRLADPIIIGDDYLASVGRNFEFQVSAVSGYAAGDLSCKFGGSKSGVGWLVSGTVSTITGGLSLKFDLPKASTSDLDAGYYNWSVEVYTTVGGIEVTRVISTSPVQLREKQT